jgi:hypothetical protein
MAKIDVSKLDINNINPEKLDLGTCPQDCSLITQTYERGAHSTYTETAVFATFSRGLENSRTFAGLAQETLSGYIREPVESAGQSNQQAEQLLGNAGVSRTQENYQGIKLGEFDISTLGSSFGQSFMDWMRDCIPCNMRVVALLELKPNIDLLATLENDLLARLAMLTELGNILSNLDIYGDYCEFLKTLNFMCVPDLQRIIALLMALLANQSIELDGLIGFLQSLVAPIFAPLMLGITSLLDQFSLLVVNPMDCIIDAINEQLQKTKFQVTLSNNDGSSETISGGGGSVTSGISSGLEELVSNIQEGKQYIQDKLQFYIDQLKSMFDELGGGDTAYLKVSFKKLTILRLVSFISAIIASIAKGQSVCSNGKSPEKSALDNFFDNFLNPNIGFQITVDDQGNLNIAEKDNNIAQIIQSPTGSESIPGIANSLTIDGATMLNTTLLDQIQTTEQILTQPVKVKIPCKLEVTKDNADLVNKWVSELNQK